MSKRRRADAERSVAAILDGATRALRERPDASVEDIAAAAGVSRQTVYAHFSSRDAVVAAVIDRATTEVTAELDRLDHDPSAAASDILVALLTLSWQALERYPFLVAVSSGARPDEDEVRHRPIIDRLSVVLRAGRRAGEFDRSLPIGWQVAAIIALGHAAGEQASTGTLSAERAAEALRISVLRMLIAAPRSSAHPRVTYRNLPRARVS